MLTHPDWIHTTQYCIALNCSPSCLSPIPARPNPTASFPEATSAAPGLLTTNCLLCTWIGFHRLQTRLCHFPDSCCSWDKNNKTWVCSPWSMWSAPIRLLKLLPILKYHIKHCPPGLAAHQPLSQGPRSHLSSFPHTSVPPSLLSCFQSSFLFGFEQPIIQIVGKGRAFAPANTWPVTCTHILI